MGINVGLWVDHRKAIIITVTKKGGEIGLTMSKVEERSRRSQDSRHPGAYESQQVPADDSRQKAETGHLNIYYDEIIAGIGGAESILIFGPGEAKDELRKRFAGTVLGGCVVAVETADKMTDRQIEAKVRKHFSE